MTYKEKVEALMREGKEELVTRIATLLKETDFTHMSFRMSTPSFNDGDPCTNEIYQDTWTLHEIYTGYSEDDDNEENSEEATDIEREAFIPFYNIFREYPDSMYEFNWGTDVTVTITPNGEVKVEEFYNEY